MSVERRPPLVSVLMPIHNGERYVGEALESVRAQTYRNLEVVVVDDGSTDGSAGIVARFDGLARYAWQPHQGIGAARNRGVRLARGSLLAFLDADDLMPPHRIEHQATVVRDRPSVDVVFGEAMEFVTADPGPLPGLRPASARSPLRSTGTMLIRREAFWRVGPFSVTAGGGVELDWRARAVELEIREEMLHEVVLERRLHDGNYGRGRPQARRDMLPVLKAALDRRRHVARSGQAGAGARGHRP